MIKAGTGNRGGRFGAGGSLMAGEPLPSVNLSLSCQILWTKDD